MNEFTINDVIRALGTDELGEALDTALETERSGLVWRLIDEMERREPHLEL
jgi:hypothetical protein